MIVSGNSNDRYRLEEFHDRIRAEQERNPRCLCCGAPTEGEYCDGCEMEGLATKDRQNREALASCPNPEETHFIEPEEN